MKNIAQHEYARVRVIEIWWKIQSSYNELEKLLTFSFKIHRIWVWDQWSPNTNGVRDRKTIWFNIRCTLRTHIHQRVAIVKRLIQKGGKLCIYPTSSHHYVIWIFFLDTSRASSSTWTSSLNIIGSSSREQPPCYASKCSILNINATAVCYAALHIHVHAYIYTNLYTLRFCFNI